MTLATTQPTQQTLTERRAPDMQAPVGGMNGLKSLLEASKDGIAMALPKHVTPERLIKTMLVAANRNPQLFECTRLSVLETINRAAELGLDLSGTLGEAYPVPFNNKIKDANGREMWVSQCQLIIGYRGLEKLAWQSGEVASIDAEVVFAKDKFIFRKGTEVYVEFIPSFDEDRGAPVGAYACVTMKNGGKLARFLPAAEIEKVRKVSKSGSDREGNPKGPWKQWWGEMARKTALRRVLKDAPLSTEKFVAAMEHEAADADFSDVIEANTGRKQLGTSAVLDRLHAKHPDGTPVTAAPLVEDEAEAMRILEASRAHEAHETQDTPPDDDGPSHESQEQGEEGVAKIPLKEIDDLVRDFHPKPKFNHVRAAREAFHKLHAPKAWDELTADEQHGWAESLKLNAVEWQ